MKDKIALYFIIVLSFLCICPLYVEGYDVRDKTVSKDLFAELMISADVVVVGKVVSSMMGGDEHDYDVSKILIKKILSSSVEMKQFSKHTYNKENKKYIYILQDKDYFSCSPLESTASLENSGDYLLWLKYKNVSQKEIEKINKFPSDYPKELFEKYSVKHFACFSIVKKGRGSILLSGPEKLEEFNAYKRSLEYIELTTAEDDEEGQEWLKKYRKSIEKWKKEDEEEYQELEEEFKKDLTEKELEEYENYDRYALQKDILENIYKLSNPEDVLTATKKFAELMKAGVNTEEELKKLSESEEYFYSITAKKLLETGDYNRFHYVLDEK